MNRQTFKIKPYGFEYTIFENWHREPIKRTQPKVNRNSKCPCGSGLKFKKCCINKKD